MEFIDNKLYIEPKEATGINYETLKSQMKRGKVDSIPNPNYNGKNAKRLVCVDSLPEVHRQHILLRFQSDIERMKKEVEQNLQRNPNFNVTEVFTSMTAQVVQSGTELISTSYLDYIHKHYIQYTEYFQHYHIRYNHIVRYARTCALIEKIWLDFSSYDAIKNNPHEYKRIRRAFVLNISQLLLENTQINVIVPQSDYRLTEWLDKIFIAMQEKRSVYELVYVKNSGNDHNQRFTAEQRAFANCLYNLGSVPSIKSVYKKLVAKGQAEGWWMKASPDPSKGGELIYSPISFGTLCLHFKTFKNIATYGRKGAMKFKNETNPTINRILPQFINEVWSSDGSPIDELIYHNGKSSQAMNSYRVYDVASNKLIGISTWKGKGEPEIHVLEALKDAIRTTGKLPKVFQCDRGGGYAMLKRFCEAHGIIFMPTGVGKSRGKLAENLISRFSVITKERPAYSGQNRTAKGENSQISNEQYKYAQLIAQPYELASHWYKTIGKDTWNDTKIEELGGETANQSPNELYSKLPCRGIALDPMTLTILTGKCHTKKLTTDGLEIKHDKKPYIYFPNIYTEDGADRGATVYLNTPLNRHPKTGKLTLYFEDYGAEVAYIFDKPVEAGGTYLDTWRLKDKVAYVASINNDSKKLKIYRAFQELILSIAKEQKSADDSLYQSEVLQTSEIEKIKAEKREKTQQRFIENKYSKEVQQADMDIEDREEEDSIWVKSRTSGKMKEKKI